MSHYQGSVPEAERPADWRTKAACLGRWNEMHPDSDEREIANAKSICKPCPVARDCFLDAVHTDDMQHGIRAGLRPNERRAVVKELQRRREGSTSAQAPPGKNPRAATLAEAVARRAVDTGDGHQHLKGVGHVQFGGQRYTQLQAAFMVGYGRDPEGIVRRTCSDAACIRAEHLADEEMRDLWVKCGTRAGYRLHRKRGEGACPPCRQANSDADNRLRRAGTTLELAV